MIREKHKTIMLEAWTTLAVALHQSTKAKHKVLHHSIYEKCRLDKRTDHTYVAGGYMDGPLAWRMVLHDLKPKERTEGDKKFYDKALQLQIDNPLATGCSPAEYQKRALRFITDIAPNLAREYTRRARRVSTSSA